nr:cag pathogenicity island protein [Helicobacter pylori]
MLVYPIKPLMGRDEILQQTPLKHPQIVPNTHGKVFHPITTAQLVKLVFI